jgi:hypothetical protein
MVLTHKKKIRMPNKVFACSADSPLGKALTKTNLMDISEWMLLMVANIEALKYDDSGTEKQQWQKLRQVQVYMINKCANGSTMEHSVSD